MGCAFANALSLHKKNLSNNDDQSRLPRLSLLNIGEEEIKGNDSIKGAYKILKNYHLEEPIFDFIGYCEPNNIFSNVADVIVCDGFAGNVALKSSEGTASMIKKFLHDVFSSSWLGKFSYFLISRKLKKTMKMIDPKTHNCGMFAGLQGILAKAHGSSDEFAFANSVILTFELIKNKINDQIISEINNLDSELVLND
jgi:glycerol-3-phosphate acyltransferase PlsX